VRVLWTATGYEVKFTKTVQTNDFENVLPVDEQMDQLERRRLLYVAATRARDHLVVSLHRKGTGNTNATILADAGAATAAGAVPFAAPDTASAPLAAPAADAVVGMAHTEWLATLERIRASSQWVSAMTASGLEGTEPAVVLDPDDERPAGAAKGARDVELPPWTKGRYGSAVGRAVHGVLQTVDLATGVGVQGAVAAQVVAEGVTEFTDVVTGLVRSALQSDVVRRAAARPHWRETYTGTRDDDGVLVEGFVDLIYRDDDGSLVVVDYKTDAIPAAAVTPRTVYYAPQIRAYEQALAAATGAPLRSVLLFLNPAGAVESWVDPA
jgi:ATP-dependent exoDNAse (exonuclease V) beta subunit